MEYTFNNSVLRTFTKLLQDTVKGRTKSVGGGRVHSGLFGSTSIQRDPQHAGSASSEENEGMEFTLPLFSRSSVVQTLTLTAVCHVEQCGLIPSLSHHIASSKILGGGGMRGWERGYSHIVLFSDGFLLFLSTLLSLSLALGVTEKTTNKFMSPHDAWYEYIPLTTEL